MRAVVTGGGGYVGHRLGVALAASGHQVLLLDLAAPPAPLAPRLRFVHADVRDEQGERPENGVSAASHNR